LWNSAVLPEGWDAEKLMGDHPSRPFNPFVAATFFRAGEIEAWGRGIQRIFAACEGAGAPSPGIRCDAGDFWLEFPFAGSYVEAVLGVSTPQVTTEVTTEVTLLAALRGEMSRRALRVALGLRNDEHFRKAYLLPALEAGLVEMTRPDRPTSREQKYRLTEKGRTVLAAARKRVFSS
jgi:ATP-dependent DNA helicase RecG